MSQLDFSNPTDEELRRDMHQFCEDFIHTYNIQSIYYFDQNDIKLFSLAFNEEIALMHTSSTPFKWTFKEKLILLIPVFRRYLLAYREMIEDSWKQYRELAVSLNAEFEELHMLSPEKFENIRLEARSLAQKLLNTPQPERLEVMMKFIHDRTQV